jgi:hypothetical protein
MKKRIFVASMLLFSLQIAPTLQLPAFAEKPIPAESAVKSSKAKPISRFELEDGTVVRLKFKETVSSKTAQMEQPVKFEVVDDVFVDGKLVIAKGSPAKGRVASVQKARFLGQSGDLVIDLKQVTLESGERIKIRALKISDPDIGRSVAVGVVSSLNPLAMLIKGKNKVYKEGEEFDAFVDGDFELNPSSFSAPK